MVVVRSPTVAGDLRLYNDEIRSVEGPDGLRGGPPAWPRRWYWVKGPQTQRPPRPPAQVLGWLFECERMHVSHSFALLKRVRRWQEARPRLGL